MSVIQRTMSCSSGVARGRRALALASAEASGMPRRAAKETMAKLRADCGSFFAAWRARLADGSYMAFSYLSQACSRDLRAPSDLVERGIAPKSCCVRGATGDVRAARLEAGSMCGEGVCAHA